VDQKLKVNGRELQRRLARYLLRMKEGERLLSVRELAGLYGTSTGLISETFTKLEANNVLKRERHGHMGSFVTERSLGKLWSIAEGAPLVISFPLASSLRLEGLATGLKQCFSDAAIDTYLIFIRGSRTRLKALREKRCHISVMSDLAADELYLDEEEVLCKLTKGSYVLRHNVFYRPVAIDQDNPLRVGIDSDSFDVEHLTKLEFADSQVEFKPVSYMQTHRLLRDGYVDAAVWSIDDMETHIGDQIHDRPLSARVRQEIGDRDTVATLVAQRGKGTVHSIVAATLRNEAIIEIQQKVLNGQMAPEY
jgi:hypothetical protein